MTYLNTFKYRRIENVDTSIDLVADEFLWLFHKAVDAGRVGMIDNDTVFGRVVDLGNDNGTFVAMAQVEITELLKWIIANNVTVEHKERTIILGKDLACKCQWTSSAERLSLNRKGDLDIVELFIFFKCAHHNLRAIVDSQYNIGNTSLQKKTMSLHGTMHGHDGGGGGWGRHHNGYVPWPNAQSDEGSWACWQTQQGAWGG